MKNNYRYQISKKNNKYIVIDNSYNVVVGNFETYENAKVFAISKAKEQNKNRHHSNLKIKISDGFHINYNNRYNYI